MIENKILSLINLREQLYKKIEEVLRNIYLNKNDIYNNYLTKTFYKRKDISKNKKIIIKSYELEIKNLDFKIKNLILSRNLDDMLKNKKIKDYYLNNKKLKLFEFANNFIINKKIIKNQKENKKIISDNLRN